MTLNEFLRATGELITRSDEIPSELTKRIEYLRVHFPTLTKEEQADLASIPLEKLSLYTRSIFSIEASILRNRLRRTVREIEQCWEESRSEPFNLRNLARVIKSKYPWKGYETLGLLESFLNFVTADMCDLVVVAPWLPDLCTYEIVLYKVRRSLKEETDVCHSLQVNALAELTVRELLDLPVIIPQRVSPLALDVRVLNRDGEGTKQALGSTHFVLIARDRRFSVRTVEVTKLVFDFFVTSERQRPIALSELAQVVLDDPSQEPNVQFRRLYTIFGDLLETGCLITGTPLQPRGAQV